MNVSDVVRIWVADRERRKLDEVDLHNQLIEKRRKAGRASIVARRLKYGLEGLTAHLRKIAPAGGLARQGTVTPAERHALAVAGGRAGWLRLTPEQARAKRSKAGERSKRTITHEQRVANGKLGAKRRWGNAKSSQG